MSTKPKKIAKILTITLAIILVVFLIANGILSVVIYDQNFNIRGDSYEPLMFKVEDFEGLSRTEYEFKSDKGQKLAGYLYESSLNESDTIKGVIIMAHGFGGGGHNSYMDCANYFAKNGYYVFAYDATGCDASEGEGVGGFSQGVMDLDHAISFVEDLDKTKDLPICLFGHSWGGYCVSCVPKYHPEVKAIIECSGFNSSVEEFEAQGKEQAGAYIYTMLPYIKLYEKIKFGEYAKCNALDGFAATDAKVMVVHSQDDGVVPKSIGYDEYYEKYKGKMEILGVDCNDTQQAWRKAVADNALPWLHVYCPKESPLLGQYQIQGFPTKVIVSAEGKIVRTVIGEDPQFYTFLDELLK